MSATHIDVPSNTMPVINARESSEWIVGVIVIVSQSPAPGLATSQAHTANDVSLEYMVSPREGCHNHRIT
jgi:hypothetical protein